MAEPSTKRFEEKLARIDAIVSMLESGNIDLEESIALFREGKALTKECERLLKGAQEQVDEAMSEPEQGRSSTLDGGPLEDEIPF